MGGTNAAEKRPRGEERPKPEGGFRFITAWLLFAAWWAYRRGHLGLFELRVWFAAHELVSRRCTLEPGKRAKYQVREVERLVGAAGEERIRAAIRRLRELGLMGWEEGRIVFPGALETLKAPTWEGFIESLSAIKNQRRRVPVPRRLVRLIAAGLGRARTATLIGHLLRCLYYRSGECLPQGLVKASWVARTFEVSLRAVKDARKVLTEKGVLVVHDTPQWLLNRWGQRVSVNLAWGEVLVEVDANATAETGAEEGRGAEALPAESAPPPAENAPRFAPPESNRNLPTEIKNQKPIPGGGPTSGGPAGFFKNQKKEEELRAPTLKNVVPQDFRSTDRLLGLFADAERSGVVGGSDADRLRFVALAEHALAVGTEPPRLFSSLVRRGLWKFITGDDEDRANARLKRHFEGPADDSPTVRRRAKAPALSRDALIVRQIKNNLRRSAVTADPVRELERIDATWTRERWEQAEMEILQADLTARKISGVLGDFL